MDDGRQEPTLRHRGCLLGSMFHRYSQTNEQGEIPALNPTPLRHCTTRTETESFCETNTTRR